MSFYDEFQIIDIIINSTGETRGVDAFALSLIKAERQMRKLFTNLIFQFPCFTNEDVPYLREVLGENRKVYFDGFERGFNAIYPRSIENFIEADYANLRLRMKEAIECRNKIFHGQLTPRKLSRDELLHFVADIRSWCKTIAASTGKEIGYDGFGRNSFQKSKINNLSMRYKVQLENVGAYRQFIASNIQR